MKRNRGFLLIEALVSLAILMIGLMFISRAFTVSLRAVAYSRYYLKATTLLEEKAIEVQSKKEIVEGETFGSFDEDKDFSWSQRISPLDADSGLEKVELSVNWQKQRNKGVVDLVTYIIKR